MVNNRWATRGGVSTINGGEKERGMRNNCGSAATADIMNTGSVILYVLLGLRSLPFCNSSSVGYGEVFLLSRALQSQGMSARFSTIKLI